LEDICALGSFVSTYCLVERKGPHQTKPSDPS